MAAATANALAADKNLSQRRLSFVEDQSVTNSNSDDRNKGTRASNAQLAGSIERRQSVWNQSRKSIYPRRLSHSMSHSSRKSSQDLQAVPRIRYQNTYRMGPDDATKFQPYKIEPKLYAYLEHALKDKKYEASRSAILTKELSQNIMLETRNAMAANSRYKLVSHVVIGEMQGQDVRFGSRCLWDTNQDNMVSVVYKNGSLYVVATVFAIYFEWTSTLPRQILSSSRAIQPILIR